MKTFFLILFLMFSLPVSAQDGTKPVMDQEDLNFNLTEDAFGNKVKIQVMEEPQSPQIDASRSLSQNLKQNVPDDQLKKDVKETVGSAQSWVKNLIQGNKENSESIENLLNESQNKVKRSNAAVFDIAGVMLQMSYEQAEAQLLKRGYRKVTQKMDIPNFIRWRNEEKCRNQGVVGYERLENCVIKLAKKDNYQYISQANFNKFDTKETVKIFLSSTFTNNKVYKVVYRSEAANKTGNSSKAIYLQRLKIFDFWKKINQKYGAPDNKEDVVWGLGANKPYLRAKTGALKLEDPVLQELDVNRMSREDQRFIHSDVYTF